MKILKSPDQSGIKITVVCSLHGEEEFSARVFDYLKDNLDSFTGLKVILANEAALEKGERCLDQDLNRSFPGKAHGNAEERLAHELMKEIGDEDFLLDVHTSVSNLEMTPILTSYNEKTKTVVNALNPKRLVFVEPPLADKALIGQIDHGVSLEINKDLAKKPEAMDQVIGVINKLLQTEKNKPVEREVYTVTGTIPKAVEMPDYADNFVYVKELELYPFLYAKDSYPHIHGLKATKMQKDLI